MVIQFIKDLALLSFLLLNAKLVQIRAARLTGKNNVSVAVDNVTAIAAQNAAIAALAVL
jgi:hypothetical protein